MGGPAHRETVRFFSLTRSVAEMISTNRIAAGLSKLRFGGFVTTFGFAGCFAERLCLSAEFVHL